MGIKDKLEICAEKTRFTLFKEGIFYKCYNEDAMVFVQRVKPYKVSSKYIKNVGAEVLSLGFPVSEVNKDKLSFNMLCEKLGADKYDERTDKLTFYLKDNLKQGFEKWQEDVVNEKPAKYTDEPESGKYKTTGLYTTELITLIKEFDLANSTPMQGLGFVQQLKMVVHKIEENNGNI